VERWKHTHRCCYLVDRCTQLSIFSSIVNSFLFFLSAMTM
jgi:hypothetical protein